MLVESSRPAFGWIRDAEFEISFESGCHHDETTARERIAWLEMQLTLEMQELARHGQRLRAAGTDIMLDPLNVVGLADPADQERISLLEQELERLNDEVTNRPTEADSQLTLHIGTTAVLFRRGSVETQPTRPGALDADCKSNSVSKLMKDSLNKSIQLVPVQPACGEVAEDAADPVIQAENQVVTTDLEQTRVMTVESVEELIRVACSTQGIRVVGSGWSWSRVLIAKPGCTNVKLEGCFNSATVDPQSLTSRVGAGLKICAWVSQVASMGVDLEWAPKGYCYGSFDSQTFGGFVANNVHHSWCNTSYHDVLSAEVLVFQESTPVVLTCSSNNHLDLFESIFGGSGFTGIILWLTIRIRPTTVWIREIDAQRTTCLTTAQVRRVMEPGAYVTINCGSDEICVTTVKVTQTTDKPEAPGLFDMNYFLSTGPLNYLKSMSQQALHLALPATDYHTANSWMVDRTIFGTADTSLIMTESADITLYVKVQHLNLIADVIGSLVSREQTEVDHTAGHTTGFTVRYVRKGGGTFAFNSKSDMIGVECTGTGSTGSQVASCHANALMRYFWDRGINVRLHPGKTFPGLHECFRAALPAETRAEAREVLRRYDQDGFFDCGELGIDDFYELS